MLNNIYKITSENPSSTYFNKLKEYKKFILKETEFLNKKEVTFNERVYCIINNIKEIQKCISCDNNTKFTNFTKGYKQYCSLNCSRSSKKSLEKRQSTMIEKYGTLSPNRDKMKETNLERYGSEYASSSLEIKNKVKKTVKSKYGVDNVSKIKEVREKVEKTMINKYGEKTNLLVDSCKEQIKETNFNKYGTIYPNQSNIIKDKKKKSNLEKYGVPFFTQSLKYKEKRFYSFLKNLDIFLKEFSLERTFNNNEYLGGYIKINGDKVESIKYPIKCLKCKGTFKVRLDDGMIPNHCYLCEKQKGGTSKVEEDINIFLEELGIYYDRNNRKILDGLELDFYFPDNSFSIELNRIYYHSYAFLNKESIKNTKRYKENNLSPNKGKNFHLLKTILANKKGIKLFHITDNEWINKKEIVKSMIKYNLGLIDNNINARSCNIIKIETKQAKKFLKENHMQGDTNSSIRLGLEYNGDIVSLMTFSKNRYSEEEYELVRFVNKINTNVRGGASRLFKNFLKNYNGDIITFADRGYSEGNLYTKLGFIEKYTIPPQYKYIKNGKIYHRMFFQKKNILKMYNNYINKNINSSGFGLIKKYNNNFTGEENLILNKIDKIYDSGHIKYVFTN